jgi:hypothetical protein
VAADLLDHVLHPPSLPTSRQRIEQRLGVLQVGGVEALGEPTVERGQQLVCLGTPVLPLPQPTQAHRRPQLERFGLLLASDV